jgi:hypothetical protein
MPPATESVPVLRPIGRGDRGCCPDRDDRRGSTNDEFSQYSLRGFAIPKESFVATATAIGLIVDGARMPVYAVTQGREMLGWIVPVVIATAGVRVGTFGGVKLLRRIPQQTFRQFVGALIALLGLHVLARGTGGVLQSMIVRQ